MKRIRTLAEDINLLTTLGEVVTVQIDLVGVEAFEDHLREKFDDAETIGLYVDGMILQRVLEHSQFDYYGIFDAIAEITGSYETIDSITALIRMVFKETLVEITVQLLGDHRPPQLMRIDDHSHYFDIVNLIQTKWQFAKSMR